MCLYSIQVLCPFPEINIFTYFNIKSKRIKLWISAWRHLLALFISFILVTNFYIKSYRVFNLIWHEKNLHCAKTNWLLSLIFFLIKALCMTFFVSKFHGSGSCSLAEIHIWSYAVNSSKKAVFSLILTLILHRIQSVLNYRCLIKVKW